MCGRFGFTIPSPKAAAILAAETVLDFAPRVNIAPGTDIPALWTGEDGRRVLGARSWGFVTHWARDLKIKPINAKAETAAEKPFFRAAYRKGRALVPAEWFYEWRREGKAKTPFAIGLPDDEPFAMAGLTARRIDSKTGDALDSICILTVAANHEVAAIHDRMPLILHPEDWDLWLHPQTPRARLEVLHRPWPAQSTRIRPVSSRVNNPTNQDFDPRAPMSSFNGS